MSSSFKKGQISLFVPSLRMGGAERVMLLFAEGLVSQGFSVDFLVINDSGHLRKMLPENVRLVNLSARKVFFALPALVRYLREQRPLAFYSTIINANVVALLARAISQVACPMIIRESNVLNPDCKGTVARRILGRVAPFVYRLADSIIAPSIDVADELCELEERLRDKVSVLPNPVVSKTLYTLAAEPCPHPWLAEELHNPPVILAVGRLFPQKDFITLIEGFAIVRRKRDARLIILGEGPERKSLEARIDKLDLARDVSLPGIAENPFCYMKRARMFALSSVYEGMPNVLIQALSLGLPAVATAGLSGAKELLSGGEFGRLVPIRNARALAEAILETLEMPKNQEASRFVSDRYSVDGATLEYLRVAGIHPAPPSDASQHFS